MNNYRRLQLIENAVTNYGGGINSLIYRISCISKVSIQSDMELSMLISDIMVYLQDINMIINHDVDENS